MNDSLSQQEEQHSEEQRKKKKKTDRPNADERNVPRGKEHAVTPAVSVCACVSVCYERRKYLSSAARQARSPAFLLHTLMCHTYAYPNIFYICLHTTHHETVQMAYNVHGVHT